MTISAYELRRHLAAGHYVELRGLAYEELVAIHEQEHEAVQGHYHDRDSERAG